ncbi:MAG: hypothetical protein Q9204_003503 [Flavoplaca sp. TL-2023a]
MDLISKHNVVHKLEKRSLLIAINCIASLSIFFFGYDQGMMGGVNGAQNYYEDTHALWSSPRRMEHQRLRMNFFREASFQFTTWGTGILNAIIPGWATETAEHKSRGQSVAIEFTLNIFGVVVAYWLQYACNFYKGGNGSFIWRFPITFQIVPLIFLFGIVWLFPKSPRWLVKVGREEEARYILGRLRGETGEDLGRAEAEFQDIRNIAELERKTASRTSYWSMFTGRGSDKLHIGRRVQLVVWLQIMQEWIGIADVTIYAPTIF